MAETIRDVVIRLTMQQVETKLKPPDLSAIEKSVDRYEKQVEQATKKIDEHYGKIEKAVEKTTKETEKAGNAAFSAGIKSAEGFKRAGEGAFMLARGVAFLSSDSEESFKAMIENVAKVQGAFDLFKGGVDTVGGLGQAIEGLGGKTAVLQKLGGVASMVFTPWGALLGGAAIGLGVLTAAIIRAGSEAELLHQKLTPVAGSLEVLDRAISSDRGGNRRRDTAMSLRFRDDPRAMLAELDNEASQAQRDSAERQRRARQAYEERQAQIGMERFTIGIDSTQRIYGPGGAYDVERSQGREERRNRLGELDQEETAARAELGAAQAKDRVELAQRLEDIERRRHETLQAQSQAMREQRQLAEGQLATQQQLLEAEKSRQRSNASAIGRLSGDDQLRLSRIAERVQAGGEINRDDAQFLGGTGVDFLQRKSDDFFTKQGNPALQRIAAAFGDTDQTKSIEGKIQTLNEKLDRLDKAGEGLPDRMADSVERIIKLIGQTQSALDRLAASMDAAERAKRAQ